MSHLTTATVLYFNISSRSTCASNVYLLNLSKFCRDISEQAHSILTQMSHPPYRASNRMQLEDWSCTRLLNFRTGISKNWKSSKLHNHYFSFYEAKRPGLFVDEMESTAILQIVRLVHCKRPGCFIWSWALLSQWQWESRCVGPNTFLWIHTIQSHYEACTVQDT